MTQIVWLSILAFVGLVSSAVSFYWWFQYDDARQRISVLEDENKMLAVELWVARKAAKETQPK
jgi:hypothetical protein